MRHRTGLVVLALILLLMAGSAATLGWPPLGASGDRVFWLLRFPRVLMALGVGAALALSGAVLQALFRNPLASPLTLGVAGGAAFGGTVALVLGWSPTWVGLPGYTLLATLGALVALALSYRIAWIQGQVHTPVLLLAGVVLNFLFAALVMALQYLADYTRTFETVRWLMGSLAVVGLEPPLFAGLIILIVAGFLWAQAPVLDLLSQGEEVAHALGVSVPTATTRLFLAVSLLVGSTLALTGPIGFVGLVVPHLLRLLVGPAHRRLVPLTLLGGAALLVAADALARLALYPVELPVGVITGLLGAPYFLWLLWREGHGRGRGF